MDDFFSYWHNGMVGNGNDQNQTYRSGEFGIGYTKWDTRQNKIMTPSGYDFFRKCDIPPIEPLPVLAIPYELKSISLKGGPCYKLNDNMDPMNGNDDGNDSMSVDTVPLAFVVPYEPLMDAKVATVYNKRKELHAPEMPYRYNQNKRSKKKKGAYRYPRNDAMDLWPPIQNTIRKDNFICS